MAGVVRGKGGRWRCGGAEGRLRGGRRIGGARDGDMEHLGGGRTDTAAGWHGVARRSELRRITDGGSDGAVSGGGGAVSAHQAASA